MYKTFQEIYDQKIKREKQLEDDRQREIRERILKQFEDALGDDLKVLSQSKVYYTAGRVRGKFNGIVLTHKDKTTGIFLRVGSEYRTPLFCLPSCIADRAWQILDIENLAAALYSEGFLIPEPK